MVRWQRPARWGVAAFGIAFAIVVYAALGERQATAPVQRPSRLDPRAILESAGAAFQQFQDARKDYVVEADQQLTYEGGATRFIGVTINVRNRGGRDFVVSGREAQARENHKDLEVTGEVRLTASDGLRVMAERATFSEVDATVRVPGAVTFEKGRMSGSGVGMTYNQRTDVLALDEEARVTVADDMGKLVTAFSAGMATLSRQEDFLALEGNVHALHGEQVLEAERGLARLSGNEEYITFIELRGNARVAGGGVFDAMNARDIDLDYTEDGATLERVVLRGNAEIVMSGGEDGVSGRQFAGESLDLTLAPDSSLTRVVGRGNVRVAFPGGRGTPARSVRAQAFDASSETGKGLTSARFSDSVEYREDAQLSRPSRTARSSALRVALADDAVTNALFTGRVRFEEEGLEASGAQAEYGPGDGTLRLSGADAGGGPRVSNDEIQIDAESIDVTLDGPRMDARGNVKTTLRPRTAASVAAADKGRTGRAAEEGRLPGLLQQGEPVNVNATTLDYQGAVAKAVYSGNATLWQGETAIRADVLTIDRTRGDLIAVGDARSNLVLETGVSVGRAAEIRYNDGARRITYGPSAPTADSMIAPTGGSPVAPTSKTPIAPTGAAQLSGPQGDLRAGRIEVALATTASRVERLEAYSNVSVRIDKRIAAGDRLTYHAEDERYVLTGVATVPVTIVEECRVTSGRTVTFFKSADRIVVDGREEVRTQSSRSSPCPQPAAR